MSLLEACVDRLNGWRWVYGAAPSKTSVAVAGHAAAQIPTVTGTDSVAATEAVRVVLAASPTTRPRDGAFSLSPSGFAAADAPTAPTQSASSDTTVGASTSALTSTPTDSPTVAARNETAAVEQGPPLSSAPAAVGCDSCRSGEHFPNGWRCACCGDELVGYFARFATSPK